MGGTHNLRYRKDKKADSATRFRIKFVASVIRLAWHFDKAIKSGIKRPETETRTELNCYPSEMPAAKGSC